MASINIQVNDDACLKAVKASTYTEPAITSTHKALSSLLLTSNILRQKAERVVSGLEAVPRTKALEHALGTGDYASSERR